MIASLRHLLRLAPLPARWAPGRLSTVVGLDIGTASIKVAVAVHKHGAARITKLVVLPTPAGVLGAEGITDPHRLAAALREAWTDHGLPSGAALVASLGGRDVVIERLLVENGPSGEIDAQVQARAVNDVPFDPEDTLYAYHAYRTPVTEAQVPVLLVGVHNAQVQLVKSLMGKLAPLTQLRRLDVHAAAIYNAVTSAMPGMRGPALLLHLGARISTAVVLDEEGRLLAARDLPRGIHALRDALIHHGVARDAAESLLRQPQGCDAYPDVLGRWVLDLASDLELVWRAAGLSGRGRPLYLSGGGSLLPDVVSAVTDAVEASGAERVDPVAALDIPPSAIDPALDASSAGSLCLLALGLALRNDALAVLSQRGSRKTGR